MENQSDEQPLLRLLPILSRIIQTADVHKKYGLTKSQIFIFLVLRYKGSMTMSEVAQYISSSKEQATRTVASLCDHGLLERYEDSGNRTHVHIKFTAAGEKYMQQLAEQLKTEISKKLTSCLTEEDIETLRSSVETTIEILSRVK